MNWVLVKTFFSRSWWTGIGVLAGTFFSIVGIGVTLYTYWNPYEADSREDQPSVSIDSPRKQTLAGDQERTPLAESLPGEKAGLPIEPESQNGEPAVTGIAKQGCTMVTLGAGEPRVMNDLNVILHFNPDQQKTGMTFPLVAVFQKTGESRIVPLLGVGEEVEIPMGEAGLRASIFAFHPKEVKLCLNEL